MRNPNNDRAGLTRPKRPARRGATPAAVDASTTPEGPVRSCILTRATGSPDAFVRLALSPDGQVLPDVRARAPGRGAWLGATRTELEAAIANGRLRGALARAFKGVPALAPDDLPDRIEQALQRHALDRIGLEAKAGNVVTGGMAVEKAARGGQLHALYHASDAADDGSAKLAQAWRVGSDAEGSGIRGLALPVPRTILSLALGRENVVHVGLTDGRAAKRVGDALSRWLHFIGPEPIPAPCDSMSQGASAALPVGVQAASTQELE